MRRAWTSVMGMLVMATATWAQNGPKYHPAEISQAGDIAYPINPSSPGFVTLDVSVDASGAVQNLTVVRDLPPLTGAAQGAVKGWQYAHATLAGKGVPGTVRVIVAFNPFNPSGVGLPGEPLQPASAGAGGDFQPAGLQKANYAIFPPNAVAGATVVLKLHVGKSGKERDLSVVQGTGVFSDAAVAAVKTWVFSPAMYQGKAVGSEVAVAFVFPSAEMGTR
jgi:TonB family protein